MFKTHAIHRLVLIAALIVFSGVLLAQEDACTHQAGELILPVRSYWQFGITPSVKAVTKYYADFSFWAGAQIDKDKYAVSTAHSWDKNDSEDWRLLPGAKSQLDKSLVPGMKSGFKGYFTDDVEKKGHIPLGLKVCCESIGFDQKGFVLYRYTATLGKGANPLNGFYLGIEVDIDAPNQEGKLTSEDDQIDVLNDSGIIHYDQSTDKKSESVLGVYYLGTNTPNISSWSRDSEPIKELDQYKVLAGQLGFERAGVGQSDWRFLISDGPFDLDVGDAVSFTFAVGYEKGEDKLIHEFVNAQDLLAKHYPESSMQRAVVNPKFDDALLAGPTEFNLHPVYPNPFNNTTQIKYDVPEDTELSIAVYNMRGRKVISLVDGSVSAGMHQTQWSGRDNTGREVSSGVYFLVMRVGSKVYNQKLILTK